MIFNRIVSFGLALVFWGLICASARACTIFVLTDTNRVLFCNNEDWINPKTRIWFVPAGPTNYGCVYVGFDDGLLDKYKPIPDNEPKVTAHVRALWQDILADTMRAEDYTTEAWKEIYLIRKLDRPITKSFGRLVTLTQVHNRPLSALSPLESPCRTQRA